MLNDLGAFSSRDEQIKAPHGVSPAAVAAGKDELVDQPACQQVMRQCIGTRLGDCQTITATAKPCADALTHYLLASGLVDQLVVAGSYR
ncbi:hypothetical protein NMT86_25370, partial [Escherichia coli]|nr:hypothetical protein [Escherichia coli]